MVGQSSRRRRTKYASGCVVGICGSGGGGGGGRRVVGVTTYVNLNPQIPEGESVVEFVVEVESVM